MSFEESLTAALRAEIAPLRVELERARAEVEALRRAIPPTLLTVEEAAERLGVSVSTVRRRIDDGSLPVRRIGKALRIDAAALHGPSDGEMAASVAKVRAL